MSSEISKGLEEAYKSIYLQENIEKRSREVVRDLMNIFVQEGYDVSDITENDIYEFCKSQNIDLNEASVNFGQLYNLINKAKGAVTSPATRQAATGLLQTGQKAVTSTAGPILSGVTRRVQSAAQTGQQAVQQATQAAAQGPKGPVGKFTQGIKRAAELATGMAPGSGSRLRRSLVVGATGGLLGSTGAGQAALDAAGRFIKGGTAAVMGGDKPKQEAPKQEKPKPKPAPSLPGFESFDPFEVIKSHLLDEGYASSEAQAIAIMANMGEGWKQSILENISEN